VGVGNNEIQAPDYSQSFNRYSYAWNNPLKFTDPSGEFIVFSINSGGLSIGVNFGVFGAGVNVGWGDGFALGAYGELGPRVGATGLGAGATLSVGFNYNLTHNFWTGSASASVYGSLGKFNAGIGGSIVYDGERGLWSASWNVSGGLNFFGNDKFGMGGSLSYGNQGFSVGVGGYYNSRAWVDNPDYEPDKWNDGLNYDAYGNLIFDTFQSTNNCYSYGVDERYNGNPWGLQPGDAGGQPITRYDDINLNFVSNGAISDGRIKKPNFLNKLGFGKERYYSVYLVIDQGNDYHFYRQDKGGNWSHKPGVTRVTNVDASGRLITNPVRADHGNYNNGGLLLWVKRK
jgi:hypothetical protein